MENKSQFKLLIDPTDLHEHDPIHANLMRQALDQARHSPPKPSNYRVGAVLVDADTQRILSSGYTLECEGNTHAEQCCLIKLAQDFGISEDLLSRVLPKNTVLYTTVEPCCKRLSGNVPCVDRILSLGNAIKTVFVGVQEPSKFVEGNSSRSKLENAGIKVVVVEGMEREILEVATAGHVQAYKCVSH